MACAMTNARRRHLRRWGAVWILTALWAGFAVGQWFSNLAEYTNDQAAHGLPFQWSEFLPIFWGGFLENHASESWQLAVQAVLIVGLSRLVFRKGDEDQVRLEAKVDRLTTLVNTLVRERTDRLEREIRRAQQETSRPGYHERLAALLRARWRA